MTISFVSIFALVWILENKSREPLKTRQYVTAETLTLHHINFFEYLSDTLNRMSEMPNGTPVEAFRNLLPNKCWQAIKSPDSLQPSIIMTGTMLARKRFSTDKSLNSNNFSGKHGGFPEKSGNSRHCQCSDKGLIPICRKCT